VARVALVARPHLPARLDVAREEGDAARPDDRRVDPEMRARTRVEDAVRVEDRIANASARDLVVEARVIRALGEPGPGGAAADEALEAAYAELELGSNALRRREHPGQVAVRRGAGDEVEPPRIPVLNERRDDV